MACRLLLSQPNCVLPICTTSNKPTQSDLIFSQSGGATSIFTGVHLVVEKLCWSWSAGFWWNHLIWIDTVSKSGCRILKLFCTYCIYLQTTTSFTLQPDKQIGSVHIQCTPFITRLVISHLGTTQILIQQQCCGSQIYFTIKLYKGIIVKWSWLFTYNYFIKVSLYNTIHL